jgi:hypothetical protein
VINPFEKRLASDVPISPVLGGYYYAEEYRVILIKNDLRPGGVGRFDTTLHQQLIVWKIQRQGGLVESHHGRGR